MSSYLLKDIEWDVDEPEDAKGLPKRVRLDIEGSGLEALSEDELQDYGFADWLSDKYGMCVRTFDWCYARKRKAPTGKKAKVGTGSSHNAGRRKTA